jgi:hypothetical protein
MTREEQIRQEIDYQLAGSFGNYPEGYEEGFIEGAKWADEHPNLYNDEKYHTVKVSCLDELNRKAKLYDEFLEKTCEWMRKQKCQEYSCGPLERIIPDFIITDYKKTMGG